jgi:hypothetical protein
MTNARVYRISRDAIRLRYPQYSIGVLEYRITSTMTVTAHWHDMPWNPRPPRPVQPEARGRHPSRGRPGLDSSCGARGELRKPMRQLGHDTMTGPALGVKTKPASSAPAGRQLEFDQWLLN